MSVRSQRHLREFYGIDSAGESDGPQTPVPALALDFITLTPEALAAAGVAYSGTSLRMRYGETGKLTYAPNNLISHSNNFADGSYTVIAATVTGAQADPFGGTTASLFVDTTANSTHRVGQSDFAVVSGSTYIFSVYVKDNGQRYVCLNLDNGQFASTTKAFADLQGVTATAYGGGSSNATITSVGSGWYRFSFKAIATGTALGARYCSLAVGTGAGDENFVGTGAGGAYFAAPQIERVTYETTPRTYNATTSAAYYAPRFDHDPITLAAKGLLIEGPRTNNVPYSQLFHPTWGSQQAFLSDPDQAISPDGTLNASKVTEDTSDDRHIFFENRTVSPGVPNTISIYLKDLDRHYVQLTLGNTGSVCAFYNLANGTLGDVYIATAGYTSPQASITSVGGGWYRCSLTGTVNADTASYFVVSLSDRLTNTGVFQAGNPSYLGSGKGVYIFGAQMEAGAFASSLIYTGGAAATRAADVPAMTGSNFSSWYNASEGTFYAQAATMGSGGRVLIAWDGAPTVDYLVHDMNAWGVVAAGVTSANLTTTAVVANQFFKTAAAYKANDFAVATDGAPASTDASGAVPAPGNIVRMDIGQWASGAASLNGWIKSVQFYNTRLTDAQLQALTT